MQVSIAYRMAMTKQPEAIYMVISANEVTQHCCQPTCSSLTLKAERTNGI